MWWIFNKRWNGICASYLLKVWKFILPLRNAPSRAGAWLMSWLIFKNFFVFSQAWLIIFWRFLESKIFSQFIFKSNYKIYIPKDHKEFLKLLRLDVAQWWCSVMSVLHLYADNNFQFVIRGLKTSMRKWIFFVLILDNIYSNNLILFVMLIVVSAWCTWSVIRAGWIIFGSFHFHI